MISETASPSGSCVTHQMGFGGNGIETLLDEQGQEEGRQEPCLGSWLKCLGEEQMVFRRKASSIHFKGKLESGLKGGGLAMKTTGVRHSN